VSEKPAVPIDEALRLAIQIADALAAAHQPVQFRTTLNDA
jgi:hypothetical protein